MVLWTGAMHDYAHQKAECVGRDRALASPALLAEIIISYATAFGRRISDRKAGPAVILESSGKPPGRRSGAVNRAQRQGSGVRRHRDAVVAGHHVASGDRWKCKPTCATGYPHRGDLRISGVVLVPQVSRLITQCSFFPRIQARPATPLSSDRSPIPTLTRRRRITVRRHLRSARYRLRQYSCRPAPRSIRAGSCPGSQGDGCSRSAGKRPRSRAEEEPYRRP